MRTEVVLLTTMPRKPRWSWAGLVGLTRGRTGCRRIYQSSWELWEQRRTGAIRDRLGPLSRAKLKWPRFELPIQQTPGSCRPPPDAGTQPVKLVTNRFFIQNADPDVSGIGQAVGKKCGILRSKIRIWDMGAPVSTPPPPTHTLISLS